MVSQYVKSLGGTLYEYGLHLRGPLNLFMTIRDRRQYNEIQATRKLQKVDPETVGWFVSELQTVLTGEKHSYTEMLFPMTPFSHTYDPALGLCIREIIVAPKIKLDGVVQARRNGSVKDLIDLDNFLLGTEHLRLLCNQDYQLYSKEKGVNKEITDLNPELEWKVKELLGILADSPSSLLCEAIQEVIEAEQIKRYVLE